MWPGPYGEWSSRKSLIASLDQSLRRMQLDYVDIFYSHRPDPWTPLEETMQALVDIVRSGKALYVGISKYPPEMAEAEILSQAAAKGAGFVAFSPLAQGLLTDRYLNGIPEDSRMRHSIFLQESVLTPELLAQLRAWNEEARAEGLSLAQYALRWILRRPEVTSVIVGASSVEQLNNNLRAIQR